MHKRNKLKKRVEYFLGKGILALSFDIFDTFLLRNHKTEIQRFYEIATLHHLFFKQRGYTFSTNSLFCARLTAHKIGYRTAPLVDKYRDASIIHIFKIYLTHLDIQINFELIKELIEIELDYEKQNLKLNKLLYDIAFFCHHKGIDTYFVSDMYFKKTHLANLIIHFSGEQFYKEIYASCEFSAAKSSGILFSIFLEKEKISPHNVLHLGDNIIADFQRPREYGINSVYIPRPFFYRLIMRIKSYYIIKKFHNYLV